MIWQVRITTPRELATKSNRRRTGVSGSSSSPRVQVEKQQPTLCEVQLCVIHENHFADAVLPFFVVIQATAAWDKSPASVARTTTSTWPPTPNNKGGSVIHARSTSESSTPIMVTSPRHQPNAGPWTLPVRSHDVLASFGSVTRLGNGDAMLPDNVLQQSLHHDLDMIAASPINTHPSRAMVSPSRLLLTEERQIVKPPSPTENATSDSGVCGSSVVTDDYEIDTPMTTSSLMRGATSTCTNICHPSPPRRLPTSTTFPRVIPHPFTSPSPDDTSDPTEQARRKQARAREQQQLILERVLAARQERKMQHQAKVGKFLGSARWHCVEKTDV